MATPDNARANAPGTDEPSGVAAFVSDLKRLRRLLGYVRPYRGRLVVGLVSGALYGAISGVFPKAIELVFKKLFDSDAPASPWVVAGTVIAIPAYFALRGLFGFVNSYSLGWVGTRVLRDIRVEVFSELQRLSMGWHGRRRVPQMVQLVNNSTLSLQNALVTLASDVVKQPITVVVAVAVIASMSPVFFVFAFGVALLSMIPMAIIGRKVRHASRSEEQSAGALISVLHEALSNLRIVRAYRLENTQLERFSDSADHFVQRSMRFRRQRDLLSPLVEVIGSLGIAATLLFVWWTGVGTSEFLAVVGGFYMMYEPLKKIGQLHLLSQRAIAVSDRIFRVIDSPERVRERAGGSDVRAFEDAIRYEGVHFRYPGSKLPALEAIDFELRKGEVCALVGPSGAGKSSIVNLLLGFFEPSEGRLTIDGRDLGEVSLDSLRSLIGLVTQETILFAESVEANIACGKPGATREEIVEAARQAQAHAFIEAMPNGYDTMLGDRGQNLSGGQRQRIAIARAFLKNPAILVLDEATSALDAESELQVREAMHRVTEGRTVLVIAHRLSTVRRADQFIVLDAGRIVESGGHEELMEQDGLYKRLFDLQSA